MAAVFGKTTLQFFLSVLITSVSQKFGNICIRASLRGEYPLTEAVQAMVGASYCQ